MTREIRLKLIMAVLTPPLLIACYLMLVGVYLFCCVTLVVERIRGWQVASYLSEQRRLRAS